MNDSSQDPISGSQQKSDRSIELIRIGSDALGFSIITPHLGFRKQIYCLQ